mmetsp:Transcript_14074/g.37795  ORF Transcript_14074/g.37795 Transcript_14074/m.37795 type:complete len:675 (-) Transcript_14074:279-2303(-)
MAGASSMVDALRGLGADVAADCVQCGKRFRASDSGEARLCKFHTLGPQNGRAGSKHVCCGNVEPCAAATHRKTHHCEYPYEAFFARASAILGYVDTVETWAHVDDTDLDMSKASKTAAPDVSVMVGKLLRWTSRGPRVQDDYLVVKVGRVWPTCKHFFHTYTSAELAQAGHKAASASSQSRTIYRADFDADGCDSEQFESAEWIVENELVCGIRIACKARSSPGAVVKEVRFTINPLQVVTRDDSAAPSITVADDRFAERVPADPAVYAASLPSEPVRIKSATKPAERAPRTNFARGGRGALKYTAALQPVEKFKGGVAVIANSGNFSRNEGDIFVGCASVVNTSENAVLLVKATIEWRFVGERSWRAVEEVIADGTTQVPLRCDPMQGTEFAFEVFVRSDDEKPRYGNWFDRSWVARRQPVRFRISLEDVTGSNISGILEYVQPPNVVDRPSTKDSELLSMSLYHPFYDCTYSVVVEKGSPDNAANVVRIGGSWLSLTKLRQLVFAAIKSGETEQSLDVFNVGKSDEFYAWRAFALVDIECRRVYAIKVSMKLQHEYGAALGYALLPMYGATDAQVPRGTAQVASEHEQMATVDESKLEGMVQDDDFDDVNDADDGSDVARKAQDGKEAASGSVVVSAQQFEALDARLKELSDGMKRIAETLELIATAVSQQR